MIRRFTGLCLLLWTLGLAVYMLTLPDPLPLATKTDGVIVVTGGKGRLNRGFEVVQHESARRLLISGVDPKVRPGELAAQYKVDKALFGTRVDLGHEAVDTRGNASEAARWIARNKFRTIRLITTDWHMARARYELRRALPADVEIVNDAVSSQADIAVFVREYSKFVVVWLAGLFGV
jgi:uncharacterized SAM-binding protein YcdF (DUF218 family)